MYCTQCGAKQPDDANFCSVCGRSLVKPIEISADIKAIPSAPTISYPQTQERIALPARGMRWFKFWVYAVLPIMGFAGVLFSVFLATQVLWVGAALFALSFFYLAAAYGLYKRRAWGWWLNWITIITNLSNFAMPDNYETFGDPITQEVWQMFAVRLTLGLLLWFLPNLVYWVKRRRLFV